MASFCYVHENEFYWIIIKKQRKTHRQLQTTRVLIKKNSFILNIHLRVSLFDTTKIMAFKNRKKKDSVHC